MRFIPTRIHGIIDYLVGLALICAPWIFGFVPTDSNLWSYETYVPIFMGATLISYSVLTNYEWGLYKYINMPVHLNLDILSGVLLAASPWLFGFHNFVYAPHLVVGLAEIVIALCSIRSPLRSTPLQGTMDNNTSYTTPSRS